MMNFFEWANNQQHKDATLQEISRRVRMNPDKWMSVENQEESKKIINEDASISKTDKTRLMAGLTKAWDQFSSDVEGAVQQRASSVITTTEAEPVNPNNAAAKGAGGSSAEVGPVRKFRSFLFQNASMLVIGLLSILILGVFLRAIFDDTFLMALSQTEVARGLITFFFALGTVGVALILVTAAFTIDAENMEEMKERFDMGKQVLTVLIGVFGTIIGFYFGSIVADQPRGNSNRPVEQTTPGAEAEPVSQPAEGAEPEPDAEPVN